MTVTDTPPTTDVEIVDRPRTDAHDNASAAIVAASDAALANPGMPGRDEFMTLATTARMLCLSGAAPKQIRNNPYVAFHVAMVGRDLGISPSAAMELIDVIDGQNGPRLSLSPQLINGQIRRLGLGSIVPAVQTAERCIAVALGPNGHLDVRCKRSYPDHAENCSCTQIMADYEWTWEDAQMANLAGDKCRPGAHDPICFKQDAAKHLKCAQGFKTYPKRMHWWRASGYLADDVFPEAGLGLYTAEELGVTVDEEGRAIDVASVALPDGYETKAVGGSASNAASEQAPDDEKWQLQLRIMALPEDVRAELVETWKKSDKVSAIATLTVSGLRVAQAMVSGAESKARTKHSGWSTADGLQFLFDDLIAPLMPPWSDSVATPPPDDDPAPQPAGSSDSTATPYSTPETAPVASAPPSFARPKGQAAVEPTEADLEGASPKLINDTMTEVLAMKAPEVDKALTALGLHTEGELDGRKHRLALARIRDAKTP